MSFYDVRDTLFLFRKLRKRGIMRLDFYPFLSIFFIHLFYPSFYPLFPVRFSASKTKKSDGSAIANTNHLTPNGGPYRGTTPDKAHTKRRKERRVAIIYEQTQPLAR